MKKFISIALAAVMLAIAAVGFASCGSKVTNYAANNTEFYIGASGPLTGPAGVYGQAVKKQVQEMTKNILKLPSVPKPDDQRRRRS